MLISVVVPVYGCPEAIKPLCKRLIVTLEALTKSYEIILVNDGCPKNSWHEIEQICKKNRKIVGINLSRNFGQIHATNAGIDYSTGDYVVLMDCDLQDKPEGIIDLYNEINKGYDYVFAKRLDRKDSKLTVLTSKLFYKVYNYFVDGYYDPEINNYCIVKREIVEKYKKIKDKNKAFTTMLAWMGYDFKIIEIKSEERYSGKSSYSVLKKINMAIDILSSQSVKPLKALMKIGFMIAVIGFVYLIKHLLCYFLLNDNIEGWTSLISVVLILGGIMLIGLGGVGIYVGNIFIQAKDFPEYLVKETLNKKNTK